MPELESSRARESDGLHLFPIASAASESAAHANPGWRGQGWGVSVSGMASGGSQTVRGEWVD